MTSYSEFRYNLISQNRPLTQVEENAIEEHFKRVSWHARIGHMSSIRDIETNRTLNHMEATELKLIARINGNGTGQPYKYDGGCCVVV